MIKRIHSFSIPRVVEVEESHDTPEGKLVKKVKKEEPQKFFIAKPSRLLLEEGELYYNQRYNEFLKVGIMPEILLRKMYGNENGIFTETEKKEYVELYIELGQNLSRVREIEETKESVEKNKEELERLHLRNKDLQSTINNYENAKRSVFDNSAETLSRDKTVFWWLLRLLHHDNEQPVFPGNTHEERGTSYDNIGDKIEAGGEEGEFYSKLIERSSFLVSLFYLNGNVKPADFDKLVEIYDNGAGSE